jgi:hypothetical protein
MSRRPLVAVFASVLALGAAVATATAPPLVSPVAAPVATEPEGRGGEAEAAEQLQETQERLDALREARAEGTFGVRTTAASFTPAPGWAGETVLDPAKDDWEPAIAADPRAPYVYVLATRYAPKPCTGNCPTPWMALAISKDGGATWGRQRPLCACKGSGQFDPIIEVVPDTGAVYAVYMNGYNVLFIRSTDHGRSWTAPVETYGKVSWNDKPVMATSDDGQDVYVSWNGPKGGDPWIAQSHDRGRTWTQTRIVGNDQYFYAYDADVLPDGTAVFGEASVDYANSTTLAGPTWWSTRSHRASRARTAVPTTTRATSGSRRTRAAR